MSGLCLSGDASQSSAGAGSSAGTLAYLSVEFIHWKWGKLIGLSFGWALAAVGGFSGRSHALGLPPPFTNGPLGWRKAKQSYKTEAGAEEEDKNDGKHEG